MSKELNLKKIKQLLDQAEENVREARILIFIDEIAKKAEGTDLQSDSAVIEGIFDGENMIGPDNKKYIVPANYASKSKLLAGDLLKLTITDDGSYLYKQIGPIKRKKLVATLKDLGDSKYCVEVGSKKYRVLPASITYFKAQDGDKLTIVVPEEGETEWVAVENLIEVKE
jgi:hypothetical protein